MDENAITKCLNDFHKFIEFIEREKPVLSLKTEVFGKKDSYKINCLLENQKPVSAPNYSQDRYPVIDLMFELALLGKLYYKGKDEKGKFGFIKTPSLASYLELNDYEKYVFLLQTYWTKYGFSKKFARWIQIDAFYNFLASIANSKPGQEIFKDEKFKTDIIYSEAAAFQHHLRFFGIGELELIIREKQTYNDTIRAFLPTSFGIEAARFLCSEALMLWNRTDLALLAISIIVANKAMNVMKLNSERGERTFDLDLDLFEVFKTFFPEEKVINTVKDLGSKESMGVYYFKVSLTKSVWRKIKMSGDHTLADLHSSIQDAFDFDDDHLYAFYVGGSRKTGLPVYCEDANEGGMAAEKTAIVEIGLFEGQKMIYLFDFGDCWEFTVELTAIMKDEKVPSFPVIVEEKGEAPSQYEW